MKGEKDYAGEGKGREKDGMQRERAGKGREKDGMKIRSN